MAHRILIQAMMVGSRVFGRAFVEAYRQAKASQKYAAAAAASGQSPSQSGVGAKAYAGLTIEEACRILHIKPTSEIVSPGKTKMDKSVLEEVKKEVEGRYKRLFEVNDPKKGGSLYLQSKVFRAKERLDGRFAEIEVVGGGREK